MGGVCEPVGDVDRRRQEWPMPREMLAAASASKERVLFVGRSSSKTMWSGATKDSWRELSC
jgi:hypothetical protein